MESTNPRVRLPLPARAEAAQVLESRPRSSGSTLASISRSGEVAALLVRGGLELRHIASGKKTFIDAPSPVRFGFGAGGLWLLAGGALYWMSEKGRCIAERFVGGGPGPLWVSRGALPACLVQSGERIELVELYDGDLFISPVGRRLAPGERAVPIGPRLLLVGGPEQLRSEHVERGNVWRMKLPAGAQLRAATSLFGGSAIAAVIAGPIFSQLWVIGPRGDLRMQLRVPRPDLCAVAEDRGMVVIAAGRTACAVDLLGGPTRYWAETPFIPHALDVCSRARDLVFAQHAAGRARAWHAPFHTIFRRADP